jgi:hypothetical protein
VAVHIPRGGDDPVQFISKRCKRGIVKTAAEALFKFARASLTAGIPLRTSGSVMRRHPDGTDQSGPTPSRLGLFQRDFRAAHKISMPISAFPTGERLQLGLSSSIGRLELDALGALQEHKVRIFGPRLLLPFDLLQIFGLAIHELTTNALKYGALKQPTGSLSISWEVRQDEKQSFLLFDWNEAGVAIPARPERKGFGRELIERALAFTAEAKSNLIFGPDGLTCHIELALPERLDRQTSH